MGGIKKTEINSPHRCPVAMNENIEILVKHKKKFSITVPEHWNRFSQEAEESPSMYILKTQPDMILGKLLYLTTLKQKAWIRCFPERLSNLSHSVSLLPIVAHALRNVVSVVFICAVLKMTDCFSSCENVKISLTASMFYRSAMVVVVIWGYNMWGF